MILTGSICLSDIPREQMKKVVCKDGKERIYLNVAEDTQNSGVDNVTPEPNAGTKTKEEQKAQDIRDGAAMIAGIQKGDKA